MYLIQFNFNTLINPPSRARIFVLPQSEINVCYPSRCRNLDVFIRKAFCSYRYVRHILRGVTRRVPRILQEVPQNMRRGKAAEDGSRKKKTKQF